MQELCQRSLWLGAYVPGWAQNDSAKFQSHEFESITYLLHFAVFVRPNGRLDLRSNGLTRSKMRSLVAVGHDSGRKVLLVVGGEGASEGLRIAWNSKNLTRTVRTLINLVEMYGYDGIDLDWEPFPRLDAQLYVEAIKSLRRNLDEISRRRTGTRVLSAAIEVDINDPVYMRSLTQSLASIRGYLDQVNLRNCLLYGTIRLSILVEAHLSMDSELLMQTRQFAPSLSPGFNPIN